jgi:hypothetical protein
MAVRIAVRVSGPTPEKVAHVYVSDSGNLKRAVKLFPRELGLVSRIWNGADVNYEGDAGSLQTLN